MKADPNWKSLCSELKESDFSLMIFRLTSVSSTTSSSSRLSILSSWGLAGTNTRLSLLLIRLCLVSFRPIFPRLYFFLRLRVSEVITSDSKNSKMLVQTSLFSILPSSSEESLPLPVSPTTNRLWEIFRWFALFLAYYSVDVLIDTILIIISIQPQICITTFEHINFLFPDFLKT